MATIINIMLSRSLGGIEQSFLDYSNCLKRENHNVINIVSMGSKIFKYKPYHQLINLGFWDYLSVIYLKFIILKYKPDIIIAHGNRAINFANKANITKAKLIGIAHNYNIKHITKCDYIFTITKHLMDYLVSKNIPIHKMKLMPNMIEIESKPQFSNFHKPLVIGSMGRFVRKKGFDHFLYSLSILKSKNIKFKAIIGGDGEEKANLKTLSLKLNLSNEVSFAGWVYDKKSFFDAIDIFCLPSIHEPFGIILLEAMKYGKTIVSTNSEGPSEIIIDERNGLLCTLGDASDMANILEYLSHNQSEAKKLAKNAYLSASKIYDIKVASKILTNHLEQILHDI